MLAAPPGRSRRRFTGIASRCSAPFRLLFDTTTLWFDGAVGLRPTRFSRGGESLGQYRPSKDYRGHLKQVVLGIVLDDMDRPIASLELVEGPDARQHRRSDNAVAGRQAPARALRD